MKGAITRKSLLGKAIIGQSRPDAMPVMNRMLRERLSVRLRYARACFGVIATLGVGLVIGCHPEGSTSHLSLRRGLAGEPSTLDPGFAADSYATALLLDLYEGLTSESATGEVIPGVAVSWKIDATGTEYSFRIRDDARWSNGEKVRAQDFVTSWQRVVNPKFGSPAADDLRLILNASAILDGNMPPKALGVWAPNDTELEVKLERAAPYFPQILAHPVTFPIYSGASAASHGAASWVSNGPYTLASWQPTTGISINANSRYWDRKHVSIKSVRYQISPDDSAQYAAYRANELDLTDTVPASALPAIRQNYPAELVISPFLATAYYAINLANLRLSSVALRHALTMAIDRRRLVEALGFGQVPAYGFVPPGVAEYTPQYFDWKLMNDADRIAEARRLYTEAGFSTAVPLHLRVLFNNNEVIGRAAVLIAAMWRDTLGIEVELTGEEFKVFLQSRRDTSRWDVARLAWNADFNDASNFLDVFRTHAPNNDMSYSNLTFDRNLDEAAYMVDPVQRRNELEAAEALMLKDYPIIPLYYFVSKRLVKPYVHGVVANPLNHVPSKVLSIDP